ncbi:MAG: Magnesium transport protein CorA [Chloroflexi bacterium]|jgi:magnesium transporter|nr:Magnesium transport protein CorA [Chloroflexota bacterium]
MEHSENKDIIKQPDRRKKPVLPVLRQLSQGLANANILPDVRKTKTNTQKTQDEPLRVETIELSKIRWVNIERPGSAELAWLHQNFDFNPLHLEDITSRLQRPKIDDYEDYLFIVLHFPVHIKTEQVTIASEIDIFLGPDYVVTVTDAKLRPLNRLFEQCKNNPGKRNGVLGRTPSFAVYRIIDVLVDYCFPGINKLSAKLEELDDEIFSSTSSDIIYDISVLRRDIIAFRRIIKPQISVIASLEHRRRTNDHEDMEAFYSDISDHISKIWDSLEEFKEIIESLSATYDSLATHRLNQIIKTLTMISVILLPLTLISGIYGMNVSLPLAEEPWAFSLILFLLITTAVAILLFFRTRKWL